MNQEISLTKAKENRMNEIRSIVSKWDYSQPLTASQLYLWKKKCKVFEKEMKEFFELSICYNEEDLMKLAGEKTK